MLYPIKFKPIYKSKVWGGDKIKLLKNDNNVPQNCGESWEISGVQNDISIVENGYLKNNTLEELIEIYMGDIVGDKVFDKFGYEFPILVKIIEAKENLSVQVHPNDEIAAERHGARGKSETWFILNNEQNSKLITGFNTNTNFETLSTVIKNNNLDKIINQPIVKSSEVYNIPSGRIHSLGKGVMVLEIQQTSDITYRLYDYNRNDRELHLELAKDALDYKKTEVLTTNFTRKPDHSNQIIKNKNYTINFLPIMNSIEKDYFQIDSFVIYFCIKGKLIIKSHNTATILKPGETILIPAILKSIILIPETYTEIIESYIEL